MKQKLLLSRTRYAISYSSLIDAMHQSAKRLKDVPKALIEDYRNSPVKHADETGWRTDGNNGYAGLFCTPDISIFRVRRTRSASVPKEVLGDKALPGILVVDRYNGQAYIVSKQTSLNYQGHGRQGQDENRIHFGNKKIRVPTWNDVALDFEEISAYVVELSEPNSLPVEWPIADGGNGHMYLAVAAPAGITWVQANSAANLAGGYLVTITSAEENDFVFKLIGDEKYWAEYTLGTSDGPWIGGYQLPGSLEPAGSWQWVIYEPFAYTNWGQGKPDNLQIEGADENCLHFLRLGGRVPVVWNDLPHDYAGVFGYVIEFFRGAEDIAGDLE